MINKLTRLSLIAWVAAIYLLAVGIHDWRLWIPLAFIALERLWDYIILRFMFKMAKERQQEAARQVQQILGEARKAGIIGDTPGQSI